MLRAQLRQHGTQIVVLADADARRGHEQVGVERPGEPLPQAVGRVASDAEVDRLGVGATHHRQQGMGVAACGLPAAEDLLRLVHVHDLVATAEDGHPGLPVHQRARHRE
jgi:hypothetical protein